MAVEVVLSTPAVLDGAPGEAPAGLPQTAAPADPAEDRNAEVQPDAAVPREPEPPGRVDEMAATPAVTAPVTEAAPKSPEHLAEAQVAKPPQAVSMPQAPHPPIPQSPAEAAQVFETVPATDQAPAQHQASPAHPAMHTIARPPKPSSRSLPQGAAHVPHPSSERPSPARTLASRAGAEDAHAAPAGANPARSADDEAALEARIRDAVQAAVRYPAAARMMGLTGRARVRLEYHAGTASPALVQSAGAPVLDDAALAAARTAHYPAPPPELGNRLLRLLVWVEFKPG